MKKIFFIFLLSVTIFTSSSCLKTSHKIRVTSSFGLSIDVYIDGVHLGIVNPKETSGYISTNPGEFSFHLITSGGEVYSGKGKVSGKGAHKWTIYASPIFSRISED